MKINSTPNWPAPIGGQANSPGLFGIAGNGRTSFAAAKGNGNGATKTDDQPRLVNGLTFTKRRSVICSRVDLASVTLGVYKRRPVPAGLSMESLITAARARAAAQDAETATPKPTPAMRHAAYVSDMREAFSQFHDDKEADFARRCAGAGHVEFTLAMEGN